MKKESCLFALNKYLTFIMGKNEELYDDFIRRIIRGIIRRVYECNVMLYLSPMCVKVPMRFGLCFFI